MIVDNREDEKGLGAASGSRERGQEVVPALSGFDPARKEGFCELCQRSYRVWSAASPIWNAVVRGGGIGGDEEFGFLCANCFMELAEDRKVATLFRLTAERTRPLDAKTPDGRVWSDDHFQWVNPPCALRRMEADAMLPFFSSEFEPLRRVAKRAGGKKSASQLASRARDLEARGLVESIWDGHYTQKMWRAAAIAMAARSGETGTGSTEGNSAGPKDIAHD